MTTCQFCGTWKCANCHWKRTGASVHTAAAGLQSCHRCGSREGTMRPRNHRADHYHLTLTLTPDENGLPVNPS